ncbi:hypothetical protein BOX15_Mlig013527g1 [Macrostomum lignano]|uniref:Uncharacterized protein n=2 Tax=Macrostomum lignano TaxID=282301 RepID=A0A267F1X0_9PLAT|nr:hypothetical protein BOX15_Mlig013527g1 [Macrostomum lignano]
MGRNSYSEFQKKAKKFNHQSSVAAAYKALSKQEKQALKEDASRQPMPLKTITNELRKFGKRFLLVMVDETSDYSFVCTQKQDAKILQPIGDDVIKRLFQIGDVSSGCQLKDLESLRRAVRERATNLYHSAGLTGDVKWTALERDTLRKAKFEVEGFFVPPLKNPSVMKVTECKEALSADLQFVRRSRGINLDDTAATLMATESDSNVENAAAMEVPEQTAASHASVASICSIVSAGASLTSDGLLFVWDIDQHTTAKEYAVCLALRDSVGPRQHMFSLVYRGSEKSCLIKQETLSTAFIVAENNESLLWLRIAIQDDCGWSPVTNFHVKVDGLINPN